MGQNIAIGPIRELRLIMLKHDSKICAVLLAGGAGTRLWPVSRDQHPKQVSAATLEMRRKLMLQQTALRLDSFNVSNY